MNNLNNITFTTIGSASSDGYFIYDLTKNTFSYANNALYDMLEMEREQTLLAPNQLINLVHPDDRDHAKFCFEECMLDLLPKKYEIRLLLGTTEKYIRCTIFPLREENEDQLCGWIEDTTIDRHNRSLIEQINARKNATLEVLSHDLKEPMSLVKLTASAIQKDIEKTGNKYLVDSVEFITNMCERNIRLVRSIINHEFLKSSIVELSKERVELVAELHDVIRTYRKSHLRELKDFRFESSSHKIYLFIDSMKFMQVINNLISNAIKFTGLNGIISVGVFEQETTVLVRVSDNGIGIPNEIKPFLFDANKNVLRKGLAGEESGGLGMNIIKSIVELHEGQIKFESTEGIGTTFYITLPK
ncbi:MAG: GHKL domain-containing protein [Chitinophagaceae bacterium]|nr:MAG: GHKL domain-containing protein [Chitinophagaceae bacterium]